MLYLFIDVLSSSGLYISVMITKIAININPDDTDSFPLLDSIIDLLDARNVTVMLPEHGNLTDKYPHRVKDNETFIREAQVVAVIGGDGTFIRTARLFSGTGTPIFGINRGRLGFLNEFHPGEALSFIDQLVDKNFTVSPRMMMQASLQRDGEEITRIDFLNDAVITKGSFSRPIRIRLEIDEEFLSCYSGDGLIIATATGSTAYSLSAGGPIMVPQDEHSYLFNPICPHMLAIRPMIIPDVMILKASIVSEFENLLLTIDGQVAIELERQDEIRFKRSPSEVILVNHPEKTYFEVLRQKLGWGVNRNDTG